MRYFSSTQFGTVIHTLVGTVIHKLVGTVIHKLIGTVIHKLVSARDHLEIVKDGRSILDVHARGAKEAYAR